MAANLESEDEMSEHTPGLKPCPFCGATFVTDRIIRDGREIFCTKCGAASAPQYRGPKDDLMQRCAIAWNTRTDEATTMLERSAVELEEAGKLLRHTGFPGVASLMDIAAERNRAFIKDKP